MVKKEECQAIYINLIPENIRFVLDNVTLLPYIIINKPINLYDKKHK